MFYPRHVIKIYILDWTFEWETSFSAWLTSVNNKFRSKECKFNKYKMKLKISQS